MVTFVKIKILIKKLYLWKKIIFTEEQKEKIKDLYVNKKLSLIKLSKEVGYSIPTLRNLLKDLNV